MRKLTVLFALSASPAMAATGPFFSLHNTDFIVTIAFLVFVGVLLYFKVPSMVGKLLDKRAATIKGELDEARALREEAQTVLASYERKHKEMLAQSEQIVANAKKEAQAAAEKAKQDLAQSIERRLAAAEGQIASAEKAAVAEVRNRAVAVAVAAASEVIATKMGTGEKSALIDSAIGEVETKLH
ncbi:F0F1 ATP synthase subunit B [Frigidibacter sp. MR17.24]|uniref:F0F1 ATP synthase subunit B n=1 Tax=Frigidibacter sp. MR17.24 TaxID=3127345 RepID=UPI0030130E7C